ncbi:MAG: FGGY-family carbohydrate kinase [Armatimonadota bacterium]
MTDCYLSFDIGTTALKTALVGADGRVLALAEVEYSPSTPAPGWMEMDPEAYCNAAVRGAREVLAQAAQAGEVSADRGGLVRAIGFSSQGETFIPLDARGEPLGPAIVWLDSRAHELTRRWEREWLSAERYRAICGYPWVLEGLTLFKIAWLRERAPELHRAAKFVFLPDWLIYRLTGEIATDFNIAQMSGMLDLRAGAWSEELLTAAGISTRQLPPVGAPGDAVGQVTAQAAQALGIPPGATVCLGCNDQLAGAIGAGNVRPGVVSETTGTALAVVASTPELLDDARFYVGRHAVPGLAYAMPYVNVSAAVLTWLRDLCADADYDALTAAAAQVPPGSDGLTVLPHFAGTADWPQARGAMVGLTLGHGRGHIARAIMESCVCLLRELLEPIADRGIAITSIRSLGRSARSDLWLQMKANALRVPVERPACPEAASLGAAMLAATGTGRFAGIAEAADAWYRPAAAFAPDPAMVAAWEQIYGRYRELSVRLYD